jgi:hypothetical protein
MIRSEKISFFLAGLLFIFIIWIGFQRELKLLVVQNSSLTFINKYPRTSVANYEAEMKNVGSFHLSPKLQSSIFFSIIYLITSTLIVYLVSNNVFLAKITTLLFLGFMILCFVLILLNGAGVDYRLSAGLAHYLEDLFLSPFPLLIIIVIIKAFGLHRNIEKTE